MIFTRNRILSNIAIAKKKTVWGDREGLGAVLLVVVYDEGANRDAFNKVFEKLSIEFEERSLDEVSDETIEPSDGTRIAYKIRESDVKIIISSDEELNLELARELHLTPLPHRIIV